MAKAELLKLEVSGIRSFSPDAKEFIEFQRPLTMILGANGCGKTTLIECLKFATTSSLPPGAGSGQSFIHDPKLANQSEVKAQIKLRFADVSGRKTRVVRSMQLRQLKTKREFKQLDGCVEIADADGNKQSLTHKCSELDKQVPTLLGVSKAILENVVFCHQEDSSWPLSESAAVKKRFDDIFSSARYTKALETLRKQRKELHEETIRLRGDAKALGETKKTASDYEGSLENARELARERELGLDEVDECKKDVDRRAEELEARARYSQEINRDIGQLRQALQVLRSQAEDLREALGDDALDRPQEELEGFVRDLEEEDHESQKKEEQELVKKAKAEEAIQACRRETAELDVKSGSLSSTKDRAGIDAQRFRDRLAGRSKDDLDNELDQKKRAADLALQKRTKELDDRAADVAKVVVESRALHDALSTRLGDIASEMQIAQTKQTQLKRDAQHASLASEDDVNDAEAKRAAAQAELTEHRGRAKLEIARLDEQVRHLRARDLELDQHMKNERAALADVQATETDRAELCEARAAVKSARARLERSIGSNEDRDLLLKDVENMLSEARRHLDDCEAEEARARRDERDCERRVDSQSAALGIATSSSGPPDSAEIRSLFEETLSEFNRLRDDVFVRGFRKKDDRGGHRDAPLEDNDRAKYFADLVEDTLDDDEDSSSSDAGTVPRDAEALTTFIETRLETTVRRSRLLDAGVSSLSLFYAAMLTVAAEDRKRLEQHDACGLCMRSFAGCDEARRLATKRINKPSKHFDKERWEEFKRRAATLAAKARRLQIDCSAWLEESRRVLREHADLRRGRENLEILKTSALRASELLEERVEATRRARLELDRREDVAAKHRALQEAIQDLADREAGFERVCGGTPRTTRDVLAAVDELQTEKAAVAEEIARVDRSRVELAQRETKLAAREREAELKAMRQRQAYDKKSAFEAQLRAATDRVAELQTARDDHRSRQRDARDALSVATDEQRRHDKESSREREELRTKADAARDDLDLFRRLRDRALEAEIDLASIDAGIAEVASKREALAAREADLQKDVVEMDDYLKFLRSGEDSRQAARRRLKDSLKLRRTESELAAKETALAEKKRRRDDDERYLLPEIHDRAKRDLESRRLELTEKEGRLKGELSEQRRTVDDYEAKLRDKRFKHVHVRYRDARVDLNTHEMAKADLDVFQDALDKALLNYHSMKIKEINTIIRDLWQATYQGDDIDVVEIVSGEESSSSRSSRSYNYAVQMRKTGGARMDMKGRCSAGQRVLASIVIRLALSYAFCLDGCSFLCLDEPTTNLDADNRASLARGLARIIAERTRHHAKFQLVVITHDERFITTMRSELETTAMTSLPEHFWRVSRKDHDGKFLSHIDRCDIDTLQV